ncbi:T9SS C-terminal target domain-containing protein [bacterium]|nr:MAG: T9SS C-terminal target domain-containing protein [bacterium]
MRYFALKLSVVFFACLSIVLSGVKQGSIGGKRLPLDGVPGVVMKNRNNSLYLPGRVILKLMPRTATSLSKSVFGVGSVDRVLSRAMGVANAQMFPTASVAQKPGDVDLSLLYTVAYSSPNDPFTLAEELSKLPEVQYAEPWFIYPLAERTSLPNDSLYGQQWALQKVNAPAAWNITQGDSTVVVAIVDSGVEWKHPDLAANIWVNQGETGTDASGNDKRSNGIDDDGNGYIDDWHGWDLVGAQYQAYDAGTTKGDNDPSPTGSNNNHGTHVAGIVAAVTDNHIGVASLAYKCRVLPIKCTADNDTRGGGDAYILAGYRGIAYAAMMGAKIINCSWGANGGAQSEQDIIDFATQQGSLVVAAAGNESSDAFFSPASYRNVLSVAATDQNDVRAWFSNYGDNVDVCSPGVSILSTLYPKTYSVLDGTSMASPLVASLAALVKGNFPTYSNLQVGEQVRVTCDDISRVNSLYDGRLGRGRINALSALTVKNLPSVRLQSFSVSDNPGGNGNGYGEPGETVNITCTFKNYLSPTSSGAVISISTDSPYLTITQGSMGIPLLGTLDTITTVKPFRVTILKSVPQSYNARIKVTLTDGQFTDSQFITFLINPTFATQNVNDIQLTLANNGRLAYLDYPDNKYGVGFIFNGVNHLYEGGLILGTSESRVVDVVRNELTQDEDFRSGDFFKLQTPGLVSDQDGFTRFSDSTAPTANRIGVRVALHSYAYSNPVDSKYIILAYEITNTTTVPLTNFRAGIFLDWDIGPTEAELKQNTSRYDSTRSLGYAYSSMPQGRREYLGIRALDSATSFRSLVNNSLDLSRAAKWDWLSGGFGATTAGPADIHHVISSGPYTVAPGATRRLAFALLAGDSSLANLQQSADAAKAKWRRLTVGFADGLPSVPLAYQLMQNYPNPFNPTTAISYQLIASSHVSLDIFDVLGRRVATLVDDVRQPGAYTVRWDASSFPSGVYFYRLEAGDFHATRKLILVK